MAVRRFFAHKLLIITAKGTMICTYAVQPSLSLQPTTSNNTQNEVTLQNSPIPIQDRITPSHHHKKMPTLHKQFTYPPGYNETLPTPFAGGLYEPFNSQGSFYLRF